MTKCICSDANSHKIRCSFTRKANQTTTMKFDTKNKNDCVAFPDAPTSNVFLRKNKFIPSHNSDEAKDDEDLGRTLCYETTVVHTPVLASIRVAEERPRSNKSPPLLKSDAVDELNQKICDLCINEKEKKDIPAEAAVKREATSAAERNKSQTAKTRGETTPKAKTVQGEIKSLVATSQNDVPVGVLGRVWVTFFSPKTKEMLTVTRSARLLERY